jgi:thiosulfate/3-mercaptopyruvate sulfurtransferase
MRWLQMCVLIAIFLGSGQSQGRNAPVFVSTTWLADHLADPDVVVLHVGFNRPEYRQGHIPGARFVWYDWLTISTPDASTEMPPVTQADTVFEALGITEKSTIVLCFSGANVTTTTRTFLAFEYFGLGDQTSILDGGFELWKSEKRPVSTDSPKVRHTKLALKVNPAVITDADWVKAHIGDAAVAIVDARDRRFYEGIGGGISRTGHIKGAISIPYSSVLDSLNRLKDSASLQLIFAEAGIQKGMTILSYCHVGQQATVIYAVAKQLGYNAAVYDGSFQDWNVRGADYPVEKPEPVKK